MKNKELEKYYLYVTEQYFRVYYNPEPRKLEGHTKAYKIKKGLEIWTKVSPIVIKDYYKENGEILGLIIEYINDDYEEDTLILKFDFPKRIVLKSGEGDVYRYSICDLLLTDTPPSEELEELDETIY